MDKGRGATSIVAVLLAGFLVKGTMTGSSSTEGKKDETTSSHSATMRGEGPWKASCKYWSSSKMSSEEDDGSSSIRTPCGSGEASWGIPGGKDAPDADPDISAIIATVPDPVHSHMALDFDRTIDSLLLAASDNRYLGSYYWLPWSTQARMLPASEGSSSSTAERQDEQSEIREQQPGLIILRYAPSPGDWEKSPDAIRRFSRAAYQRVVYLFLVAETPTLGVNGTQLQNAFRYETMLLASHKARLSMRLSPFGSQDSAIGKLSVIGPLYSGSAASLHAGIEAAKPDIEAQLKKSGINTGVTVEIAGATGTRIAVRELDPYDQCVYRSFGENPGYEQKRLLRSLHIAGYDLSRVAVLSEEGTVFGSATKAPTPSAASTQDTPETPGTGQQASACTGPREERSDESLDATETVLDLRFPRELSLLRNAQSSQAPKPEGVAPSPYLNLTLKDHAADDSEPRLSIAQSPLSIEAQLMAIAHQLQRARVQFILMSASNVLDDIYLAQFLRRACPDARIVILGGADLLFERDVDNEPYIGSIGITPYLLTSLDSGNRNQWLYSDSQSEAVYNAASYIFWDETVDPLPRLAGYGRYSVAGEGNGGRDKKSSGQKKKTPVETRLLQVPLWATAMGADGYYPLAILSWCGSDFAAILPAIHLTSSEGSSVEKLCSEAQDITIAGQSEGKTQAISKYGPESISPNSGVSPSLLWTIIAGTIIVVCAIQTLFMLGAQYWSPSTRDFAIDDNDQPYRRAVLLNIGMACLVSIAFVTAWPLLRLSFVFNVPWVSRFLAIILLVGAIAVLISTLKKTGRYLYSSLHPKSREYLFFNIVTMLALVITIGTWISICASDAPSEHPNYAGVYFSYRCLQPTSGVCPLLPILLLLTAWLCWSICQTARLRFSDLHRSRIAQRVPIRPEAYPPKSTPQDLFVSDEALQACSRPIDCCLYSNITSLLITREVVWRFINNRMFQMVKSGPMQLSQYQAIERRINLGLSIFYVLLFAICLFASHIQSLDRFVFMPIFHLIGMNKFSGPTLYEFLIISLFFPLIMISLAGYLRTILIWGSLSRGLLEPLERLPIRFAFSRIKIGSWMTLLRQSGLNIRWRDMSRSIESIRQFVHHPDLVNEPHLEELKQRLTKMYEDLNRPIMMLLPRLGPPPHDPISVKDLEQPLGWDCPSGSGLIDLYLIYAIELRFAEFCHVVLRDLLIPHWEKDRVALVEDCHNSDNSEEASDTAKQQKKEKGGEKSTSLLDLAEELIVIRYIAVIRAVLVNMRYLMLFVSTAFVLSLIAWNSYPFQPHALIDWCFTILLSIISIGFIAVFAQIHRNGILSRITNTEANVLGWDFYLRLIMFGAVPVLTWLAYQFPQIGGSIYRLVQPGLQVVK